MTKRQGPLVAKGITTNRVCVCVCRRSVGLRGPSRTGSVARRRRSVQPDVRFVSSTSTTTYPSGLSSTISVLSIQDMSLQHIYWRCAVISKTGGEAEEGGGRCQEEGWWGCEEEVCPVQHGLQLQQPSAEGDQWPTDLHRTIHDEFIKDNLLVYNIYFTKHFLCTSQIDLVTAAIHL